MTGAYYERLGVASNATHDEIRAAYRRLARRHHPDARGQSTSATMAAINEAWSVLSDPARRARYDADLARGSDAAGATRSAGSNSSTNRSTNPSTMPEARLDPLARYLDPPRFPWRLVVALVVLATAAILILGALADSPADAPIDNLLQVGSCVDVDEAVGEAFEVACDGPHDGIVGELVPFDSLCSNGRPGYRDRQGMGLVCVAGG